MQNIILLLESATDSCSVALSSGERLIAEKYINEPKVHASKLALYVEEILKENSISVSDCSAIAVSSGPGSYTGLRVGVSCAKGLCFGANKPLIAVNTLAAVAHSAIEKVSAMVDSKEIDEMPYLVVPMIDAGRMEVYTASYSINGNETSSTIAKILDEKSYSEELSKGKVLFTGNGAAKFMPLLDGNKNALFIEQLPHASGMRVSAAKSLAEQRFEDNAYFEPFYLKDFIPGKPKKLL